MITKGVSVGYGIYSVTVAIDTPTIFATGGNRFFILNSPLPVMIKPDTSYEGLFWEGLGLDLTPQGGFQTLQIRLPTPVTKVNVKGTVNLLLYIGNDAPLVGRSYPSYWRTLSVPVYDYSVPATIVDIPDRSAGVAASIPNTVTIRVGLFSVPCTFVRRISIDISVAVGSVFVEGAYFKSIPQADQGVALAIPNYPTKLLTCGNFEASQTGGGNVQAVISETYEIIPNT